MAIRRKKETLLKVDRPKLKIYINGHPINIWIDSGSPISILTLDDLKKTVGRTGINLKQDDMDGRRRISGLEQQSDQNFGENGG